MKPNDENGKLPTAERPFRVLLIAGSDRRQYNCPGVDSKARALMLRMAGRLPDAWEVDYEDLGNVFARARIQRCNACVSTSMALCVWPCNCYEKHNKDEPDLMWDLDLYARLDLADARLKWRAIRLGLGVPPAGSSPAAQQRHRAQRRRNAALLEERGREAARVSARRPAAARQRAGAGCAIERRPTITPRPTPARRPARAPPGSRS